MLLKFQGATNGEVADVLKYSAMKEPFQTIKFAAEARFYWPDFFRSIQLSVICAG